MKTRYIFMSFDSSAEELEKQLCSVHCRVMFFIFHNSRCRIVKSNGLSNIFELRRKE